MAIQSHEQLNHFRVLVVEDNYLIAEDVAEVLREVGIYVVGPVGKFQEACHIVQDTPLDCAVLDINIVGGTAFPLIDVLIQSNVPVLLMTGYDQEELPVKYRSLPLIQKPLLQGDVVGAFKKLFER